MWSILVDRVHKYLHQTVSGPHVSGQMCLGFSVGFGRAVGTNSVFLASSGIMASHLRLLQSPPKSACATLK